MEEGHSHTNTEKGDRSLASYYRPVSLASITCNVMKHSLCSNLMTHLETQHILTDLQYGFTNKNRCCESQLITTIHDLAEGLNDNDNIDAIHLDFSKAFVAT